MCLLLADLTPGVAEAHEALAVDLARVDDRVRVVGQEAGAQNIRLGGHALAVDRRAHQPPAIWSAHRQNRRKRGERREETRERNVRLLQETLDGVPHLIVLHGVNQRTHTCTHKLRYTQQTHKTRDTHGEQLTDVVPVEVERFSDPS